MRSGELLIFIQIIQTALTEEKLFEYSSYGDTFFRDHV